MIKLIKYLFSKHHPDINFYIIFWCRLRNHPKGVIWYNSGSEPDMRCRTCLDDLG